MLIGGQENTATKKKKKKKKKKSINALLSHRLPPHLIPFLRR
jgi:hypothetical protein